MRTRGELFELVDEPLDGEIDEEWAPDEREPAPRRVPVAAAIVMLVGVVATAVALLDRPDAVPPAPAPPVAESSRRPAPAPAPRRAAAAPVRPRAARTPPRRRGRAARADRRRARVRSTVTPRWPRSSGT